MARAYCFKDHRYVLAGTIVPSEVVDQVHVDMRQRPFRVKDVVEYCAAAMRAYGGPVSAAQMLAERIARDCRTAGWLEESHKEGRFTAYKWRET
ncbi:MAG: hypothetical protein EOP83_33295 [Verrucomicrobiaceae bacterium]|nr:MAG: hypothetical protein EOP83_33295 [Verrucomicrobiaceae bacterium]